MRSVRYRLTVWYAVLLLAVLVVFSASLWFSLRQSLLSELDEEVAASAERFRAYFIKETATQQPAQITDELEEYCQALPPSTWLDLRGAGGYEFHYPPHGHASKSRAHEASAHFRAAGDTFTLTAGASQQPIDHTLDLLRLLLLGLVPLVVAIATFGGAWMSRRALRPVDEVTTAARNVGIENLAERLPVPPTGDEFARLTEVWNTMLERLDGAVKTLSQFAADASHELRTPLAVIRTGAELALRRERTPREYRESLVEIAAEAERMTGMVEDLLYLARSDARTAGMPMESIELSALLAEVTHELQALARTREIEFEIKATSAAVTGNRPALRRLFLALLDNAVKYSPAGAPVSINLHHNGRSAVVEVSDRGAGIAPEDLPHIFQRFYRGDKARSNGGHGLGLSLASAIAKAHNGTIEVRSEQSAGGATLRVSIPTR